MFLPCEIAVKTLVPAIRSAIAKELIQTCRLKQKDVATILGVTQTAVSKYFRNRRGIALNVEEIEEVHLMIKEIVGQLANGDMSKYELVSKLCVACEVLRQKGFMCDFCKRSDSSVNYKECLVCH